LIIGLAFAMGLGSSYDLPNVNLHPIMDMSRKSDTNRLAEKT
jgi:hypothetical protein